MISQYHFYFTVTISAWVGVAYASLRHWYFSQGKCTQDLRAGAGLSNGLISDACGGI